MPTYEYACRECGRHLEVVQSFTEKPLTKCPSCKGALKKVFSPVGIVLKGSGFYRTDSRPAGAGSKSDSAAKSESASSGTGKGESSKSESSGSSGSSGSGDAKPSEKKSEKKPEKKADKSA